MTSKPVHLLYSSSGQDWVVSREDGTEIATKVVGIEQISENERIIWLSSHPSRE